MSKNPSAPRRRRAGGKGEIKQVSKILAHGEEGKQGTGPFIVSAEEHLQPQAKGLAPAIIAALGKRGARVGRDERSLAPVLRQRPADACSHFVAVGALRPVSSGSVSKHTRGGM